MELTQRSKAKGSAWNTGYDKARKYIPFFGLIVAIIFPFVAGGSPLSYMVPALIWGIAAIGWTTIFRTGQFSMGQGGLMLIGGYVSAILTASPPINSTATAAAFHWPVLIGILIGGIAAAILALVLGLITLRLGGLFFATVTLAFGEVVRVLGINVPGLGGVTGMPAPDPQIFGLDFEHSKIPFYFLALGALVITSIVFWRMDRSRLGRLFRSVSSNPNLASQTGVYLTKYRVIAFVVAGFFAGIAGALFGHYLRVVTPTLFGFTESTMILIMCTVGGTRNPVAGAVVGALLLSPLGDYLTSLLQGAKPLVFGVIVVLVAFFLIDGITGVPNQIRNYFVNRSRRDTDLDALEPGAELAE